MALRTCPPTGSLGDLDGGEDNAPDTPSLSGEEGGASDPEESAEGDASSPSSSTAQLEGERTRFDLCCVDPEQVCGPRPGLWTGSPQQV